MRILSVRAEAFGPLEDCGLELAPGLNVIVGPNEAGKSSWHAAIFAGLCGLRRIRGGQKAEDRDFALRYRPWSQKEWVVRLQIELDDGSRLELRQDLSGESESTVSDLVTGRPATADLMREGAPDGAVLLGLSRRTLPATLAVRQAEILKVLEGPDELQQQLQRAASTGGEDATAQAAIEAIKAFHLERVGPERKGSRRPLKLATEVVEKCREELELATDAHRGYLELLENQQRADDKAAQLESQLETVRRELERRDLAGLRTRVERARGLAGRFPAGQPEDPERLRQELTEVALALSVYESRPSVPELPPGRSAAEIEARLEELPEAPVGDTEPEAEVLRQQESLKTARHLREAQHGAEIQTGRKPQTGGAGAGEMRRLAAALEAPEVELDPELEHRVAELRLAARRGGTSGSDRLLLGCGAGAVLAGITLLAFDLKALGLGLAGVGIVLLALGWRRLNQRPANLDELPSLEARLAVQREAASRSDNHRQAAETKALELGLRAEPSTLRRLAGELETFEVVARSRQQWQERLDRLQGDEEDAAGSLRELLLARVEVPEEVETSALWERYLAECRERAAQAEAAERRPSLSRELEARRALERAAEEDLRARAEAASGLIETGERVGLEAGDEQKLPSELRAWRETREADRRRLQQDREEWVKLQEILGGRQLAELEADLERAEAALEGGGNEAETELPEDLQQLRSDLERENAVAASERDRLSGQVVDRGRSLTPVAEVEEALHLAVSTLERVRSLDATLQRTHAFLDEARERVQRDIAPRISAAIGPRLAAITDRRYSEVLVDPATLEVRVRASDGELRPARQLSHGTSEQVYLLLRLALAELLVTTGESAPLFFDDVTVQSDATRTRAILELLHQESALRQIVFFSQEEEVVAWAKENLQQPVDRLIDLAAAESAA